MLRHMGHPCSGVPPARRFGAALRFTAFEAAFLGAGFLAGFFAVPAPGYRLSARRVGRFPPFELIGASGPFAARFSALISRNLPEWERRAKSLPSSLSLKIGRIVRFVQKLCIKPGFRPVLSVRLS